MLLAMFLISSGAAKLPELKLGARVPSNAKESESHILVSPAQIQKEWRWTYDGEAYSLGVDENKRIQFLSTKSPNVMTPEGVYIGQSFSELKKVKGVEIFEWPGWGYVAELKSGWMAAIFIGYTMTEHYPEPNDKVQLLFRGTAAGYGETLSQDK